MTRRMIEIESKDIFGPSAIATTLSAREEISRLYEYVITIASEKISLGPADIIGKPFCVSLSRQNDEQHRFFHGYINQVWCSSTISPANGKGGVWRNYRIRVVPSLWFMTQAAKCFVYLPEKEKKSIQEVLGKLFDDAKKYAKVQLNYELSNAKILQKRKVDHCVQYRESDFNFLARTLENYGVYYYFDHQANSHTCHFSDLPAYPNCIEKEVEFRSTNSGVSSTDAILSWEHGYDFIPGRFSQGDYNYMTPSEKIYASVGKHKDVAVPNDDYEIYDHPGFFDADDQAEEEGQRRLESEEIQHSHIQGTSNCKTFEAGYCFKLINSANASLDKKREFLITSISHLASQPGPFSDDGDSARYSNQFTCIPRDRQFRPRRISLQPLITSVQTATVVGPDGEEIHTDKEGLGRVKIQFHWDRENRSSMNEHHSCWVRVSQVHAGKGFGAIDLPRVGEEVIVSFIEGNVDRPIITGRVYNKEAMPPFKLPEEKTRSGYKSKTYKGEGYNELTFDDKPGHQQVRVHAEKDMLSEIKANVTKTVGNNETITIGTDPKGDPKKNGTLTATVFGDTKLTVTKGDYNLDVKAGCSTIHVGGEAEAHYDKSRKVVVGKEMKTIAPTIKNVGTDLIHDQVSSSNIVITKDHIHLGVGGSSFIKIVSDGILLSVGGSEIKLSVTDINMGSIGIKSTAKGFNEVSERWLKSTANNSPLYCTISLSE